MERPASSDSSVTAARAWLTQGRHGLYALGGLAIVVVAALALLLPTGGPISTARMAQLIDTAYNTSGTHCVAAAHGRDLCHLKAEKCKGTLLVAPSSEGRFTTVSSTPEQLDPSSCVKSEGNVGGFE